MADNDNGSGLGWFLAGLGVGAVIGVLYAPKAGKDTRDDIVQASLDAKDKASVYAQQGIDKANDYVAQGKQVAADYADKGKQAAGEYGRQGQGVLRKRVARQWTEYVEKGKNLVQDQQDKVQSAINAGKDAYANKVEEHVS